MSIRTYTFGVCLLCAVLFAGFSVVVSAPVTALATVTSTSTETVNLFVNKHISGDQNGFELSDFAYQVNGNGVDELVPHEGTVVLGLGTYTIEEIVPDGFVKEDWRIGWYGACDAGDAYATTITIDEGNIDDGILECEADNQYRPQQTEEDPIPGCTDPEATNYDPAAETDDGSCEYEGDEPVRGCTDPEATNYDPLSEEDDGSCTYDTGGGEDNGTTTEYLLDGFVWHDSDTDGVIDEDEEFLSGWTVTATNGSTTHTTMSNEEGYYSFMLPEGVWILSEEVMSGWVQVFPNHEITTHTVTVPDDLEGGEEEVALIFPFNLFFTVAHAQTPSVSFNFGNVFNPSCNFSASAASVPASTTISLSWDMTGADSVSINNGIGSTTLMGSTSVLVTNDITYTLTALFGSSAANCPVSINVQSTGGGNPIPATTGPTGGGKKIELSESNGGGGVDPVPEVLGEQVTAIPLGAANTGAGGASTGSTTSLIALLIALVAAGFGRYTQTH